MADVLLSELFGQREARGVPVGAGAETRSWVPRRKVEEQLESDRHRIDVPAPGFFAQNLCDDYQCDIVEDNRLFVPAAANRGRLLDRPQPHLGLSRSVLHRHTAGFSLTLKTHTWCTRSMASWFGS
jgi:hypothetical protein